MAGETQKERQFVDTTVLVYAHDISAGEKHTRAKALITELWQSGNGCLSIQVLQEFYVTVTQKVKKTLRQKWQYKSSNICRTGTCIRRNPMTC